ncbi:SPX domain-containing protein [Planoprotostelium fungivorum]|uniref:SPX domain-containing protein n=1 Tax=Planoprotostelium fungivorum TaxID=1890364 RepID=A0A2P6N4Z4_9EUKA|nr:SPX domain-containing protein [Planoprotostelium fungivorum]
MKFGQFLAANTVPEWRGKYLNYKGLKKKIKATRREVLDRVTGMMEDNHSGGQWVTGEFDGDIPMQSIRLSEQAAEVEFYQEIEKSLLMVNEFYNLKEQEMTKIFYGLVIQAIRLHLIEEYVPEKKRIRTRLERELTRLKAPVRISYDTQEKDDNLPHVVDLYPVKALRQSQFEVPNDAGAPPQPLAVRRTKGFARLVSSGEQILADMMSFRFKEKNNDIHVNREHHDEEDIDERPPRNASDTYKIKGRSAKVGSDSSSPTEGEEEEERDMREEAINEKNMDALSNAIQIDESRIQQRVSGSPRKLKHAFREYYRGLILLKSYCAVNNQALRKIMKKHRKNVGTSGKSEDPEKFAKSLDFPDHSKLMGLISETETLYSVVFTEGHRRMAMRKLRIENPDDTAAKMRTSFTLGVTLGLTLVLIALMFYLGFTNPGKHNYPRFDQVIVTYRGIDMYIWTKFRVNYPFIFEFPSKDHVSFLHVFQVAAVATLFWTFNLFLYILAATRAPGLLWLSDIPWQTFPLTLAGVLILFFFIFQTRSNFWLMRTLGRLFSAPFIPVVFRDFFMGDQLMSTVIVLQDLEFSICFFSYDAWAGTNYCTASNTYSKPIIVIVPAILRFLQCLRRYRDTKDFNQVLNAGKYATTFLVATFSTLKGNLTSPVFLVFWVICYVISTAYTYTWDVKKDWSLEMKREKWPRSTTTLYPKWFYAHAAISNFFLRLAWTLTTSPRTFENLFAAILASLEIVRRTQWNLIRVENEQLNNIGKFRATDVHVPLPDSVVSNFSAAVPKSGEDKKEE